MANKLFSFDYMFPKSADRQANPFDCNDRLAAPSHMDDIFPSMAGSDFLRGRDAAPRVKQAQKAPRELGAQHIIMVLCIDKSSTMGAYVFEAKKSRMKLVNQYARELVNRESDKYG